MKTAITRQEFLRFGGRSLTGIVLAGPFIAAEGAPRPYKGDREKLTYNNPFDQQVKTAWYDGKMVRHLSGLGAVTVQPLFKIAQQYNIIYEDQFKGPTDTVEKFEDQEEKTVGHAIFDSAPGDPGYSPIWHINWVIAPRDYKPNTIRSANAVRRSGYKIIAANIWEN
jgi:hypothetical protein